MRRIPLAVAVSMCFVALASLDVSLRAQPLPMQVKSPVVSADGKITFRFLAPNAKEVNVTGEFAAKPLPMTKDAKGQWTATTDSLAADVYRYYFVMDGTRLPDPANTYVVAGSEVFRSMVLVPGEKSKFLEIRDVPHGSVHAHWYDSKVIGNTRRVVVYTPPDYDSSPNKTNPVLYLMHGATDDENGWTQSGRANFIMDNLIAEKKATPAVIVMPFGHVTTQSTGHNGEGEAAPAKAGGKGTMGGAGFDVALIEKDLFESVMPLVEKQYRISKEAKGRAIAGLSMGGYQALTIGLNNSSKFAYVGGFSAATINGQNYEANIRNFLADADKANRDLKLLYVSCGTDDSLISGNRSFEKLLSSRNVNHVWVETPGYAHVWTLWRVNLNDLLQRLFKE